MVALLISVMTYASLPLGWKAMCRGPEPASTYPRAFDDREAVSTRVQLTADDLIRAQVGHVHESSRGLDDHRVRMGRGLPFRMDARSRIAELLRSWS